MNFYHIKLIILTFEEFNNEFGIDNRAMSNIKIEDKDKDISIIQIEIVMRDQTPDSIKEPNCNITITLHPTDGTHWFLFIRREAGPVYYFDSFGVETPPLFLKDYVELGSIERIQEYDESYCGAYCLDLIYLIDFGFRIKNAWITLVNQFKCPGGYKKCWCYCCKVEVGEGPSALVLQHGRRPMKLKLKSKMAKHGRRPIMSILMTMSVLMIMSMAMSMLMKISMLLTMVMLMTMEKVL